MSPCRKFRPPTGPNSPAQKNPASAAPSSARDTIFASWSASGNRRVPLPLQVKSSAPAGRPARLGHRLLQQRSQLLVGRRRVPQVEADRLAHLDAVPNGQRARVRVDADHAADQEVALPVLALVLVDDAAHLQPSAASSRSGGASEDSASSRRSSGGARRARAGSCPAPSSPRTTPRRAGTPATRAYAAPCSWAVARRPRPRAAPRRRETGSLRPAPTRRWPGPPRRPDVARGR